MTNVIEAEEKFVGKEKQESNKDAARKKARDLIYAKNVWFAKAGHGIQMETGLQELFDDAVGKDLSDSYLLFCICEFAKGHFGDTPPDIDIMRLNNIINRRRVQGRYPINPEKDIDEKGNEFWIVIDDGHRGLMATTAEDCISLEEFYKADDDDDQSCDECNDKQ